MMKFKANILFVWCIYWMLCASHVNANDKGCPFESAQLGYDIAACTNENGVDILKLMPPAQDLYEANLDRLPTFIVSGGDLSSVLKVVGNGEKKRYNDLIALPNPSEILHFDDGSDAVKRKIAMPNWTLLDVKDVVYGRPDGSEGAGVVCSTHERKIEAVYVAVSQCNSFYESDVIKLKAILQSLDSGNDATRS
ncbi:hypothetical protein ACIOZM_25185 [Pseudomonas sp. NPDC087346]|uniref:hypothetical protein n=1 Tax=Pseudomonas sp. NPDC087346 TaxID=3364438 RepID=UPI00381B3788